MRTFGRRTWLMNATQIAVPSALLRIQWPVMSQRVTRLVAKRESRSWLRESVPHGQRTAVWSRRPAFVRRCDARGARQKTRDAPAATLVMPREAEIRKESEEYRNIRIHLSVLEKVLGKRGEAKNEGRTGRDAGDARWGRWERRQ